MKKIVAISLFAGTLVTVGVGARASFAENGGTGCWDVYARDGSWVSRVVPKGLDPADCTAGAGCFESYQVAANSKVRVNQKPNLIVPMGADPANGCIVAPPTTDGPPATTTSTTTTSTTTTSTTSTTVAPATTVPSTTTPPTTAPATTAPPATTPPTTIAPPPPPPPTPTTAAPTPDPSTNPPSSSGDVFFENFEDPNSLDNWQTIVANGRNFKNRPTQWKGDHSADCGGPNTTRTIRWPDLNIGTPEIRPVGDTLYWCAPKGQGSGHIMTSFLTGGYAHVDFTPKRSFVDVDRVCWDQNVTNLGNRKWTQVTIVPKKLADKVAPRLDWTRPDKNRRNGPADWGLNLDDGAFMFSTTLGNARTFTDGLPSGVSHRVDKKVSDKVKRVTTCIENIGSNKVLVEQERYNGSTVRTTLNGRFPAGEVKVVFQDVSYNPRKAETKPLVSNPTTWHWDNILIES